MFRQNWTERSGEDFLLKLKMIKEGVLIDHVKKENQYEHLIYYGIVKNKLG